MTSKFFALLLSREEIMTILAALEIYTYEIGEEEERLAINTSSNIRHQVEKQQVKKDTLDDGKWD